MIRLCSRFENAMIITKLKELEKPKMLFFFRPERYRFYCIYMRHKYSIDYQRQKT